MVKLWIDDLREPPDDTWLWAKSSYDAFQLLQQHSKTNHITHISFDHDLGENDTSQCVANYIETMAYYGTHPKIEWAIHSANPVGRQFLTLAMESADRYWSSNA